MDNIVLNGQGRQAIPLIKSQLQAQFVIFHNICKRAGEYLADSLCCPGNRQRKTNRFQPGYCELGVLAILGRIKLMET